MVLVDDGIVTAQIGLFEGFRQPQAVNRHDHVQEFFGNVTKSFHAQR